MAKQTTQMENIMKPTQIYNYGLPAPFDLEKLHEMILNLYFHQVRSMNSIVNEDTLRKFMGMSEDGHQDNFFSPTYTPKELGLQYSTIRNTTFAECIEKMYQYAYFGILDESAQEMEYESDYTWVTALLSDMKNSRVFEEWESYGSNVLNDAEMCLQVAELANARIVLEGGENFFYFGSNGKEDDSTGFEGLTVRQMALLSGMEEMSIRAAANPKRANPLLTYSEDGRTRILIEVAKAWLQNKGRYVTITRQWGSEDIDLAKRTFSSAGELISMLNARCHMLVLRDHQENALLDKFAHAKIKVTTIDNATRTQYEIDSATIRDINLIRELAKIMEFPADILVLRAREALAKDELTSIERELRNLVESKNIPANDYGIGEKND